MLTFLIQEDGRAVRDLMVLGGGRRGGRRDRRRPPRVGGARAGARGQRRRPQEKATAMGVLYLFVDLTR